ncbi:MAG: putative mRNA 3-end processing factor [Lentimonas sp.]|jgi:putative mRNA 3-end processing factor
MVFAMSSWINHDLYIEPIRTNIDPIRPVNRAIITHGHADHARSGHNTVLATPQTIEIMKLRYGENCAGSFQALNYGEALKIDDVTITLYPAGHILGSAQVLIEYQGQRVVATGDYKTKAESTAQPFELVPCDIFITEATFGLPVFQHPDPKDEIARLLKSVTDNPQRCHVIGAYALGKTQRVIRLIREAGYDAPIYLHGANTKLCDYYQSEGIDLGDLRKALNNVKEAFKGAIVIAPPSALKDRWSRRLPDPVICYASGWMSVKQRAKQSLVELPLIISDHADWNELTETIPATGAETVWVTHGREDALVHWCTQRGLTAQPLSIQGREEETAE